MNADLIQEIHYNCNINGSTEMLKISPQEFDAFWSWFQENAIQLEISPDILTQSGCLKNAGGRCFGNSQFVYFESGLEYWEGFMKVPNQGYIFHGFNLKNGKVIDITVGMYPDHFKFENGALPSEYCGIRIPAELFAQNQESLNQSYSHSSYLHQLFALR